jgi:archaellum component FlaC
MANLSKKAELSDDTKKRLDDLIGTVQKIQVKIGSVENSVSQITTDNIIVPDWNLDDLSNQSTASLTDKILSFENFTSKLQSDIKKLENSTSEIEDVVIKNTSDISDTRGRMRDLEFRKLDTKYFEVLFIKF